MKEFLHQPCSFNYQLERRKFVRAEWFIHGCTTLLKMRSCGNSKRSCFQTFWSENNTYWSYHNSFWSYCNYPFLTVCSARNKSGIGHFPINFNIWPTKIHFGRPNLLCIYNGMAIDNLQKCPIFKKWPTNF